MATPSSITVTGLAELQASLGRALQQLQRPSDLMQSLGATLEGRIERRFDTKTDPDGMPWAPLAESTRERYDAEDTATKGARAGQVVRRGTLLERTGQMRNSLAVNAGDDWVEVGMSRLTDDGRWQIPLLHEHGTDRGLPRRGIFFSDPDTGTLSAGDETALVADVEDWLDEIFGPA